MFSTYRTKPYSFTEPDRMKLRALLKSDEAVDLLCESIGLYRAQIAEKIPTPGEAWARELKPLLAALEEVDRMLVSLSPRARDLIRQGIAASACALERRLRNKDMDDSEKKVLLEAGLDEESIDGMREPEITEEEIGNEIRALIQSRRLNRQTIQMMIGTIKQADRVRDKTPGDDKNAPLRLFAASIAGIWLRHVKTDPRKSGRFNRLCGIVATADPSLPRTPKQWRNLL